MDLEGELRVQVQVRRERVRATQVVSSRPDVAAALLRGRTRAELQAAVPRLFSICSRAQSAACAMACAAAAGSHPSNEETSAWHAGVAAERLREAAWQVLLHWPRSLRGAAEAPEAAALAAARTVQSWDAVAGRGSPPPWADAVAQAALGLPAADWLAIGNLPDLRRWADRAPTAAARFVRERLDEVQAERDAAAAPSGAAPAECRLLPAAPDGAWLRQLATELDADAGFERRPAWQGRPAETGALSRLQDDPLLRELAGLDRAAPGGAAARMAARCVARLRELARLLAAPAAAQCGALPLADGQGLGWVHSARGLLVHAVRLRDERVEAYRIVAPTEWNFHPQGALPLALQGAPAADRAMLQAHAMRLIHSLDPCVACRVEVHDA